ncbi:DNA excision repair protein ERCC-6-like isoform X2 [Pygocentrus nattereri]|uniref:DNA excision repair protein ERCC-6-like isoform X2 n=1 Tax=Pygocentrus nattereri TaxID=42514 RepID=UPI00081477A3|nr:DNA excision repair protein ERCC-6-like isoform X2 [Pygocentrus nattereri]
MEPAEMEMEMEAAAERLQRSLNIDGDEKARRSLNIDGDEKARRYQQEAKEAAQQGNLERSLELFRLAYQLRPSAKLKNRIQRLQEAMQEQEEEEEGEEFINVNDSGLMLYKELCNKLYDHQKEGVAFLYGLHRDGRRGGILADDMGLGKTIQVVSFLSGMYDAELAKHTLLVMPTSLIKNWVREFAKWTPGMRVKEFHGTSKTERNRNLERIQRKGGAIITTYQMVINNWEQLSMFQQQEFCWDYVILDEAHKIKTPSTKTAKCARAIPARHRLLLTGTPVQNNLREMWALFDFACQGALLGTAKTFKTEYENPITRAREKDSTPGEKALGLKISQNLMELIKPYFLRRTKDEVQQKKQSAKGAEEELKEETEEKEDKENGCPNIGDPAEMPSLTRKNDLIIWTYLSPVQEDIYKQFISLDHIKELLMTTRSPLAELTVLKKLCDHPRLLSARAVTQLGLEEGPATDHALQEDEGESAAGRIDRISDKTLLEESGKLRFLMSLLEHLREENHRTLVFSQSRKMLDIIERVLRNRNFRMLRVDGTVTHLAEREKRIALFQTDRRYSVFLLTTQVGGVGITLTAANRVVIFDPSWNPATDAQAVDRAYRIGQTENVVIYRLITCGTVEEKIYRRQVFKDSLIRQTTGDKKNPFRYFSKQELKELFTLEDAHSSSTQLQLQALHSQHRRSDPELDSHIAKLHRMEMFGISDHDLLFSKEAAEDEDDPQDAESDRYIQTRVQKAQELVQAESELHGQMMDSVANSTEPAWLRLAKQREIEESSRKKPTVRERGKATHDSSPPSVVDLTQSCSDDLNELSYANEVEIISEDGEMENKNERMISGGVMELSDVASSAAAENSMSTPVEDSLIFREESSTPPSEEAPSEEAPSEEAPSEEAPSEEASSSSLCKPSLQMEDKHEDHRNSQLFSPHVESPIQSDSSTALLEVEQNASLCASVLAESFQGKFNLQLEDSADLFSGQEEEEEGEEEMDPAEEQKFQLQLDISGDRLVSREASACGFPDMPKSTMSTPADESFLHPVRKKKAQVLCDSEEEEEEEGEVEKPCLASSPLGGSFKSLGSSTPKSVPRNGALRRRSLNTSVASRRSFVESLLEDLEEEAEDYVTEGAELSQASEASGTSVVESVEEEEEPSGETLNSENLCESEGVSRSEYESGEEEEEEVEEEQSYSTEEL